MHIALVLIQYKPFGGYERQAKLLADTLLVKGHKITIISSHWTGEKHSGLDFYKIPILKGTSWLKATSFALLTYFTLGRIRHRFDRIIAFDRSLGMNIYRASNACHRAWLATRRQHQEAKDHLSILCNPLHFIINRIEKAIFRHIETHNGTVIVLSPSGAEQIRAFYSLSAHRFIVIPPAVDFSRFPNQLSSDFRRQQRVILGLDDKDLLLLHVGSGFRIKGVDRIIQALPFVDNAPFKTLLIIVGADKKGQYRYLRLAKKLGVEHRVEHRIAFVGGVEDVGRYSAAADPFLLLSWLETIGAVVAEALWFGLPVLLGAGVGATCLIGSEHLGRVVTTELGAEKLAGLISTCIASDQEAQRIGSLSAWKQQRLAAEECHPDHVMNRYLHCIEKTYA